MIRNKKIVLTGANSGIGLCVLKILAGECSNTVFAVDKNIDRLASFGKNVIVYQCDVGSKQAVDELFEQAVKALGDIDIFYANAGFPYYEKLDYTDWDRCKAMFDVNVFSPIYSYEKYVEYLNGRNGIYAMTVSAIGKMAMPGFTLYSASKFALHGFQEGIRFEKPDNVQLTCLYPIATNTDFFKAANPREFERPFPVQQPEVVAAKMVKGIEKGKKAVNPSGLFTLSGVLFTVLPFTKKIYLALEKAKFNRFCQGK